MYWKGKSPSEPQWQLDSLRTKLVPFDLEQDRMFSPEEQAYCRYYNLDLEVKYPRVRHALGVVTAAGYRLAVHAYLQPEAKGTIFVLHGYFDHAGLFTQLFDVCLKAGFNVVCWDLPGHGLSSGDPAAISSFAEYQQILDAMLERCQGAMPTPWLATGQSTGGAVLIDYLLSHGHTPKTAAFRQVVLLAPLIRPMGWGPAKILHSLARPFISTWKRVFSENSGNPHFLHFLREKDPLQARAVSVQWVSALREWIPRIESAEPVRYPLTVVQGELDLTVDWPRNLRTLRKKFRKCRIVRLPQGRHHLVNDAVELQTQVFQEILDSFNAVVKEA